MSSRITTGIHRLVIAVCALLGALFTTVPAFAETGQLSADQAGETQEAEPKVSAEAPVEAEAESPHEAAVPTQTAEPVKEAAAPGPQALPPISEARPPEARPPEPPKEPPKAPSLVQLYGIIKPEVMVAQAVETFGKAMMVAPTAAAHPIADPNFQEIASSFQLQQSRFGMKINDGNPVSGRIEIDFIDDAFSHSSPIQGAGLRLRLAYVAYKPAIGHTVQIGQAWDIFSPLNALSMNMVAHSYQAGNSAFIRPQIMYTYGKGQGLEIAAATGLRAQNVTQAINAVEQGLIPTFALQVGTRMGKTWLGASGIIGAEEATPPPGRSYNVAAAGNLFANLALSDSLTVISEAYVAQNANALGLITLGSGAGVIDVGGYFSGNLKLDKVQSVWLTLGVAGVLNPDDLPLGYTPAVAATPTTPAIPAARVGMGGIEVNANLRATYIVSPLEGLQFYLEPFLFLTKHKLDPVDDPTGQLGNRAAYGAQLGTRYTF